MRTWSVLLPLVMFTREDSKPCHDPPHSNIDKARCTTSKRNTKKNVIDSESQSYRTRCTHHLIVLRRHILVVHAPHIQLDSHVVVA